MLQKYDIFAYMELLSFPKPPAQFQLAVVRCKDDTSGEISGHFPQRDINAFSNDRLREHVAVVSAISNLINHDNWHLEHGNDVGKNGAPELFENAARSKFSISISHCSDAKGATIAAVCLKETTSKIGVDIVLKADERIPRVAPRTMSERELGEGQLERVWAVKESMFKAFGPGMDFKNDLEVTFKKQEVVGKVRGEESQWWVEEKDGMVVAMGPI